MKKFTNKLIATVLSIAMIVAVMVPVSVSADANVASFAVTETLATMGDTQATVPVSVTGNTGFDAALLTFTYSEQLVLSEVTAGDITSEAIEVSENTVGGCSVFVDGCNDVAANGVLVNLIFALTDTPVGTYQIGLSIGEGNVAKSDETPLTATATSAALTVEPLQIHFTVASTVVDAGESIQLAVTTDDNFGIFAARFAVSAPIGFTLTNATSSMFEVTRGSYILLTSSSASDVSANGEVLKLYFDVEGTVAAGDYTITLNYSEGDITNIAENSIPVVIAPGTVTVNNTCEHTDCSWTVTKAASCTETGTRDYICNTCGTVVDTEVIPMVAHTFGNWTTTLEPTCGAAGSEHRVCQVCGLEETNELAATGVHTFGEWVVTKEATELETGTKERTCSVCGAVDSAEIPVISAHVHEYGEWTVRTPATCVAAGEEYRACSCGDEEVRAIPATGVHTYGEWVVTKEATAMTSGLKHRTCTVCGAVQDATIPKVAASAEWVEYNGNKYYFDEDGEMLKNGMYEINGLYYYFFSSGVLNTGEKRGPLTLPDGTSGVAHFYAANSIVNGIDVSYSYKVGWVTETNGNIRYYPSGANNYCINLKEVEGKQYFFNGINGALYIPKNPYYGAGWYLSDAGVYFALDPTTGEYIWGWHEYGGRTYYYKDNSKRAGMEGLQTIDGNMYYFQPDSYSGAKDGRYLVKNQVVKVGLAYFTCGADGKITKIHGIYNNKFYLEDGTLPESEGIYELDGVKYCAKAGGQIYTYWYNNINGHRHYFYNGVELIDIVYIDMSNTSSNTQFGITSAGYYFFNELSPEKQTGWQTATNGYEYLLDPTNGGKMIREEKGYYSFLPSGMKYANFFKEGTIINGVDVSYAHKLGLFEENGVLHYYKDGNSRCLGFYHPTTTEQFEYEGHTYSVTPEGVVTLIA